MADSTPSDPLQDAMNELDPDQSSFAFAANVGSIRGADSLELAPGHVLRRAFPLEAALIKWNLNMLVGVPDMSQGTWEIDRMPEGGLLNPLPATQWKYHVVAFRGFSDTFNRIETAAQISATDLDFPFVVLRDGPSAPAVQASIRWMPPGAVDLIHGHWRLEEVDETMAEEIRSLAMQFDNDRDPAVADISKRSRSILGLKALPHGSMFRVLGYFAALESLLTHHPQKTDPYDSITRQIKKKVALLNNRWSPPLDYSQFATATPESVWAALYEFRSRVAHGSAIDFKKGDLKVLKNEHVATDFVKQTVKAALRAALAEPQLVADLREI